MRHALKNSIKENMHGLLESIFVDYANQLRANYPERTIRNGAVFASGVLEFARLGYIELVDARTGIPDGVPAFLVRTIKRAKHQPIWIPGANFPDDPWDLCEQMKR
jgi:tRNA A37 N6-isopentenylltransferase MiaA